MFCKRTQNRMAYLSIACTKLVFMELSASLLPREVNEQHSGMQVVSDFRGMLSAGNCRANQVWLHGKVPVPPVLPYILPAPDVVPARTIIPVGIQFWVCYLKQTIVSCRHMETKEVRVAQA